MSKQIKRKVELKSSDTHCLLSIYTVNEDYRLAWLLNEALGLHMQRDRLNNGLDVSLFSDRNTLIPYHFTLISNKKELIQLLPQYEQINFFLKISNIDGTKAHEIINKIRHIESVTACSIMDEDSKLLKIINKL